MGKTATRARGPGLKEVQVALASSELDGLEKYGMMEVDKTNWNEVDYLARFLYRAREMNCRMVWRRERYLEQSGHIVTRNESGCGTARLSIQPPRARRSLQPLPDDKRHTIETALQQYAGYLNSFGRAQYVWNAFDDIDELRRASPFCALRSLVDQAEDTEMTGSVGWQSPRFWKQQDAAK